jgi:hypothetical protein
MLMHRCLQFWEFGLGTKILALELKDFGNHMPLAPHRPEPCIYSIYDRIFGVSSARNTVYTPTPYMYLSVLLFNGIPQKKPSGWALKNFQVG